VFSDAIFPSTIPIFPLPLVLFPGQIKQLRIFEPRYRAMLSDCLEDDAPFGIVLTRTPRTGGSDSLPYRIGTLAHITQVDPVPDDTFHIQIYGGERFSIQEFVDDAPYLQANIENHPLLQTESRHADDLQKKVRLLLSEYLDALTKASGMRFNIYTIPTNPQQLAYLAAVVLQTNSEQKQTLLASAHLPDLFVQEINLLTRELDLMAWINATIADTQDSGFGSDNWLSLN